jgi:hypothetical protein
MAEATEGTFTCEKCKRSFAWKPQLAGKRVACKCGGRINVPPTSPPRAKSESAAINTSPTQARDPAPIKAAQIKAAQIQPAQTKPAVTKTTPRQPAALDPTPAAARPSVSPSLQQWSILHTMPEPSAFHTAITPHYRPTTYKSGKRGALIFIGSLSILVGLVCGLINYIGAAIWNRNYVGSVPHTVVNTSEGPMLPPPNFAPYSGVTHRATGLSSTECIQIAAATPFDGPFGEQRRDMLERLLSEAGTLIMPNLTSDSLRPTTPPANTPDTPDRPARFLAPHGVVTVDQDWAKYESQNQPVVSVDKNIAIINGITYLSTPRIEQNLRQLRDRVPKMTSMQLGYVAEYLLTHPFNSTAGNKNVDDSAQNVFGKASLGGVKILTIDILGEYVLVLPNGRGTYRSQAPAGLDIVTNCPMLAPPKVFQPLMPGDPEAMFWLSVCCLTGTVLAVYLILAGIITLIWPARWARLHMAYAILSILLIFIETGLSVSLYNTIATATAKPGHPFENAAETERLIAATTLQIIYPLVLIGIYMRNPRLGRRGM